MTDAGNQVLFKQIRCSHFVFTFPELPKGKGSEIGFGLHICLKKKLKRKEKEKLASSL